MRIHVLRLTAILGVAALWLVLRHYALRAPATDAPGVGSAAKAVVAQTDAVHAVGPAPRQVSAEQRAALVARMAAARTRHLADLGVPLAFGAGAAGSPAAGSELPGSAVAGAPSGGSVAAESQTLTAGSATAGPATAGSATAGSATAGPVGSGADVSTSVDSTPVLLAALAAATPELAKCAHAPDARWTIGALLTVQNDHALGAVVDVGQLVDAHGARDAPLPPELEACLRGALEHLAWPPLGPDASVTLRDSFVLGATHAAR